MNTETHLQVVAATTCNEMSTHMQFLTCTYLSNLRVFGERR